MLRSSILAFALFAQAPTASVPSYPNVACPIMGKPISTKLYTDTALGRMWVCCKSCIKDIQADVAVAHRTAYPTVAKVENKICPVGKKPIGEGSVRVVLQGFEFSLCCEDCAATARAESQVVLAKLNDEKLADLANSVCPVSGEKSARNVFVVIDGNIVRLSDAKCVAEVEKDPAKVLARAKEIRAADEKLRAEKKSAGN